MPVSSRLIKPCFQKIFIDGLFTVLSNPNKHINIQKNLDGVSLTPFTVVTVRLPTV